MEKCYGLNYIILAKVETFLSLIEMPCQIEMHAEVIWFDVIWIIMNRKKFSNPF